MDLTAIDTYLERARRENDVAMRPCGLVTDAFLPLPAHKVGAAHLFLRPRMILADPTGCGKTPQTLVGWAYLKEKQPTLKLLVVTGKSSQFQWRDSVLKFLTGVSAAVIGYDAHKTKVSPAARYADYARLAGVDVWITTYALLAKDEAYLLPLLSDFVLVFDEVHHIDNRKQETLYPCCARFAAKAKAAWGLSATPMDNGRLDEVYSLFDLIRPGTLGDYPTFRKLYYVLRLVRPRWRDKKTGRQARPFYEVLGHQNLPHLAARIDKFYLRRPAEAIREGLPPITFQIDSIELGTKQQALYTAVYDGQMPGAQTRMQKLAALTRAQQAADAPEVLGHTQVGNAKLDRLMERLTGDLVGQKVILYSKYVQVVHVIEERLRTGRVPSARVTGDDTLKARDAARARFMDMESGVNLICVTDAGGESLDLQAAQIVLLYDLPWTHGSFTQIIGRARRIGSNHANILTVLLSAAQTIDEEVAESLLHKERTVRAVIRQGNDASGLAEQLHETDDQEYVAALLAG